MASEMWKTICGYLPMFRKTHDSEMESLVALRAKEQAKEACERKSMRHQHALELSEAKSRCDEVLKRLSEITFRRGTMPEMYIVSITFDVRMFSGRYGIPREEMQFIGDRIGHQVACEIASSKFVQKANDHERERMIPRYIPPTAGMEGK